MRGVGAIAIDWGSNSANPIYPEECRRFGRRDWIVVNVCAEDNARAPDSGSSLVDGHKIYVKADITTNIYLECCPCLVTD